MTRLHDWTPDDDAPGAVVDVTNDTGWDEIRRYYFPTETFPSPNPQPEPAPKECRPLEHVIANVRAHHAKCVLIEYRYIDFDYRSEHSRFYSTTFRRYPSVTHRLHFFAEPVDDDLGNLNTLGEHYIGYSVMRPLPGHPVGRTMIKPPPDLLRDGVVCVASEDVHLFGVDFEISAMPFVSQDAQYLRCAHAAQWMVLQHSHLVRSTPRRVPADIHDASRGGVIVGRQIPSGGLSAQQLLAGLHNLGVAADRIRLPASASDNADRASHTRLHAVVCRYVNSETPPIVISENHAWVIVGYSQDEDGQIVLYRHDDEVGPYIPVFDPFNEQESAHREWKLAIPPLPQKCYMPGERAEPLGRFWLSYLADQFPTNAVAIARADDNLTFRSYAVEGHRFKKGAIGRLPDPIAKAYCQLHLPKYVWVVEALDRDELRKGNPIVLGEALIDATADHEVPEDQFPFPTVLALHAGGVMLARTLDWEIPRTESVSSFEPYATFAMPNRRPAS